MRTPVSRRSCVSRFTTRFGSLEDYQRGHLEIIDDEPHH